MQLDEILKAIPDPGPHPKVEWGAFCKLFKEYVLSCIAYPSIEDKREWSSRVNSYATSLVNNTSYMEPVQDKLHEDDYDELTDAIATALILVTNEIIDYYKIGANFAAHGGISLRSTIDHGDPLPIDIKNLRKLIEGGCKGFTAWSHKAYKYADYLEKKGIVDTSATLAHLTNDIAHEVKKSFPAAITMKLGYAKDHENYHDWHQFSSLYKMTKDALMKLDERTFLIWLDEHNKGARRENLYFSLLGWTTSMSVFAKHDAEVHAAMKHSRKDQAFNKKVLKVLIPFFEQQLKAAHG